MVTTPLKEMGGKVGASQAHHLVPFHTPSSLWAPERYSDKQG